MCLAIPGKLLSTRGEDPLLRMGSVAFGGVVRDVSLAFTPDADVGCYVLVHVGFAIARLDETEALRTLDHIKRLEAPLDELEGAGN